MFVDRITTNDKQLLLIQSDAKARLYEWISGEWEPVDPSGIDGIVISGNARVEGIMLSGKTDQPFFKSGSRTFVD